jgi:hypothetical protein
LNIDKLINFSKNLLPTQGNIEDFTYGLAIGVIIGNYSEKFFQKHARNPDDDELIDIYYTMSLRSPRLRKSMLDKLF